MDKLVIEAEKLNLEIIRELKILVEIDLILRSEELDKIENYFTSKSLLDMSEKGEVLGIIKILKEPEPESAEDIFVKKNKLYSYYRSLLAYKTEIEYLTYYIKELIFLEKSKDIKLDLSYDSLKFEKDRFLNRLDNKLINYTNESQEYSYISKELLKALPFRLSKYKFYNKIESSLKFELANKRQEYVREKINTYKYSVIGVYQDNYGILFDYYFTEIEKIRLNLKLEKVDNHILSNRLSDLLRNINMDISYIFYLGKFLNNLVLLKQLEGSVSNGKNIKEEIDLEDLFSLSQNKLLESQKSIINFFNQEKIDKEKVLELDSIFSKSTYFMEVYNREEFLNFPLYSQANLTLVGGNLLELEINNLISYLDRNLKKLNRYESRVRMKLLLLKMNRVFLNKKEILDYVGYSLDSRLIDKNELYLTFELLNRML